MSRAIELYPDIGCILSVLCIGLTNHHSSHSVPTSKLMKFPPEFNLLNWEVMLNDGVHCVVVSSQCGNDFQVKAVGDSWIFLVWKTQDWRWICQLRNQWQVYLNMHESMYIQQMQIHKNLHPLEEGGPVDREHCTGFKSGQAVWLPWCKN